MAYSLSLRDRVRSRSSIVGPIKSIHAKNHISLKLEVGLWRESKSAECVQNTWVYQKNWNLSLNSDVVFLTGSKQERKGRGVWRILSSTKAFMEIFWEWTKRELFGERFVGVMQRHRDYHRYEYRIISSLMSDELKSYFYEAVVTYSR